MRKTSATPNKITYHDAMWSDECNLEFERDGGGGERYDGGGLVVER